MPANSNQSVITRTTKRILRWLLTGLILAAALWLAFMLTGRALCHITIGQIAELTNTKIETESVDFNLNGSVFIERLVINPHKRRSDDDAILKAETVYARFGIASLLLLRPRLKEINVKDFVFDAQYDFNTGRWNVSALKIKFPKIGPAKMPFILLEKGTLQYSRVSNGQVKTIAAVPVDARFEPAEKMQDGYSFNITTAKTARISGKSTLKGTWKPGQLTFAGGISSTDIPAFEKVWSIYVLAGMLNYDQDNNYSLTLRIDDLAGKQKPPDDTFTSDKPLSLKKFRASAALQNFFNQYHPWGKIDIDLKASGNLTRLSESTIDGRLYCKDISICNRKFPYLIENLAGPIDFTEKNILLDNLRGRHKDVELAINGSFDNFGPNLKSKLQITSANMALDKDLYNALDPRQKRLWTEFSPSGFAAIDYTLSQNPQAGKKYTLNVELLNAEAKYAEFPYPLKNLTGHLLFDHNSIDVRNLVSQLNERKIAINGKVTAIDTDEPEYNLLIKVNNVPLDSTLAAALPSRQRNLYNQFELDGLGDGEIKVYTQQQDPGCATFTANLDFKNTSLKMQKHPIAISDISAKAVFTPDSIRFENFTGRAWEGLVSLTGQIRPGAEAKQDSYHLSLHAKEAQLSDSLISILPAAAKSFAYKMQPDGKVNFIADLKKTHTDDYPDYEVVVECLGNTACFDKFPYPLKDITGSLTITKDSIRLDNIGATAADNIQITPDTSTIKIHGEMALVDNAFSNALFTLCANDILFDERLSIALSKDVRPFYAKLSPTGRFDLHFENIRVFNAANGEKYVDLAGIVKFKGCSFDVPGDITDLDAVLKIKGLYKTGSRLHDGQAALMADSLKIKGMSLTALKADIHYDHRRRNWMTKNFIADCYGGRLTGKFEFKQPADSDLEYLVQIGFDNIDLKQFLSDVKPKKTSGNSHTTGKLSGSLGVIRQTRKGTSHNYPRIGRCKLQITDMQVGKASLLAKLLSVLKLTEPRDFAFDRMLIDSYIKGNRVYLEHLDLVGQTITFSGSGWIDLQSQNVNLTLFARGSRLATAEPSILESLTEGITLAVIRMDVTGNLYDPQVTRTTLPVLKGALEILGTKPPTAD